MTPFEVWYQDSEGFWAFFYSHYGQDFRWAVDDARKTAGIDIWAIARGTTVLACSKDAPDMNSLKTYLLVKEALQP